MGVKVLVCDRKPVQKALRRLKRLLKDEGLHEAVKAKRFFGKPRARRRREARVRLMITRTARRLRSSMS